MTDKRFEQLVADHFDRPLTPIERAELETHLLNSPEARKSFADAAVCQVQLTELLGRELPPVPQPAPTTRPLRHLWPIVAAATVLAALSIWFATTASKSATTVVLLDAVAADWQTPAPAIGEGTDHHRFILNAGLAKLHLAAGTEIILAGPCEFEVPKYGDAILHRGRLAAELTPGMDSFAVRTPHGRVVDRGTTFGLEVTSNHTHLHVFSGRVAAIVGDAEIGVGANAALTFDSTGAFGSIPYDPAPFQRRLPTGRNRDVFALHPLGLWSFDQSDLSAGQFADSAISGRQLGVPSSPTTSFANNAGHALELTGGNAIDLAAAPQFERTDPFSISVWFRPADDVVPNRAILSQMDGNFRGWDLFWMEKNRICVHVIHQWDVGGGRANNSIRLNTAAGFEPGDWYHLVVTYDGSSRADGFRIFVNGDDQPTEVSHDNLTRTIVSDATLLVGKRPARFHDANTPPVRGAVDEVVIFDRQLTPAEVIRLHRGDANPAAVGLGSPSPGPSTPRPLENQP